MAKDIPDEYDKYKLLLKISKCLCIDGMHDKAIQVVNIANNKYKSKLLFEFSEYLYHKGLYDEANQISDMIPKDKYKLKMLIMIAESLINKD